MSIHQQIVFDAIHGNIGFIPRAIPPFAVGGYINGAIVAYQWTDADWNLFPDSYHIRINVTGDPTRGNALDVENGDATPSQVQPWIESRAAGQTTPSPLLVYCNRSNLAACTAGRDAAYKAVGFYADIWCSTLDGTITGNSMTQFGQINGGKVDVSLITNPNVVAAMAKVAGIAV